jgi:hypothetical protein
MTKDKSQPKGSHLPDKRDAPKRSGRKGIGPLDVVKDFDSPVRDAKAAAANDDSIPAVKMVAGQPVTGTTTLLVHQPKRPTVVGDRFEAFFLKPSFTKTKEGKKLVSLRFTVPLEDEHEELLPKIVHEGYKDVKKKGRAGMRFNGKIPGQAVDIYLSQDIAEEALTLPAAKFANSRIDIIERKGEGQARQVIRLSFTLQVEQSHEVRNFASENHGNNFWLQMEDSEEPLFDEED